MNYRWADKTYGGPEWRSNGARRWFDDLQAKYPDGVPFTADGFPDFSRYSRGDITSSRLTGDYTVDAKIANAAYRSEAFPNGLLEVPRGWVWHHVEDARTMQLVPEDIHYAVRHTGGVAAMKLPK